MEKTTLNLGCGDRIFEEYPEGYKCINMDVRDTLSKTDTVCDVTKLSFNNECFDYILASDILEHFPIAKTKDLLKEWKGVLKTGGVLEIRCPNLKMICERYIFGQHTAKFTSWLLYGGQDYPLNFHYVAFDGERLTEILKECGFETFYFEEMDDNNMHIKARKKQ